MSVYRWYTDEREGDIFNACISGSALTTGGNYDLFGITAPAGSRIEILGINLGQSSNSPSGIQALGVQFLRGSTAVSPTPITPANTKGWSGAPVSVTDVTGPSTTLVSTASASLIYADAFNAAGGRFEFDPQHGSQPVLTFSQRLHVRVSTPQVALTVHGTLTYREIPAGALTTWTPAALNGLIGWYKADVGAFKDAGVTLAKNGETVQQWNDQSGNANHLSQSAAANRPTFNTNVQNTLPGIGFVSSIAQQSLDTPTLTLGGTTASVFCVIKGATPAANARGVSFRGNGEASDSGNTGSAIFLYYPATTTASALRNSVQLSNGTIVDATFTQLGSIYDGVNNTLYIGGTAQAAAANSNTFDPTGVFSVGAQTDGTNPFDGTVLELLITNRAVSASDRAKIKAYFTTRWGV